MHRKGGFARAAFFIAEHDDVRGRRLNRTPRHEHDATSLPPFLSGSNPGSRVGAMPSDLTINGPLRNAVAAAPTL